MHRLLPQQHYIPTIIIGVSPTRHALLCPNEKTRPLTYGFLLLLSPLFLTCHLTCHLHSNGLHVIFCSSTFGLKKNKDNPFVVKKGRMVLACQTYVRASAAVAVAASIIMDDS